MTDIHGHLGWLIRHPGQIRALSANSPHHRIIAMHKGRNDNTFCSRQYKLQKHNSSPMKATIIELGFLSLLLQLSHGWVSTTTSTNEGKRKHRAYFSAHAGYDQPETSRREWLGSAAAIVGGSCIVSVLPANAADVVKSTSVCDASVSAWKRNGRVIYVLGTAHVSSSSAELAGKLVQDTQPAGVFVELDPKRIKGSGILANRVSMDETTGQEIETPRSIVIVPDIQKLSSSAQSASPSDTASTASTVAVSPIPASKPNAVTRAAGAAVGNSIKGMYKKLDSAGFNAGEEFVVAIREGQKIG